MQITIDIDDHLADIFMTWMSCSGEQGFWEWSEDHKKDPDNYIKIDYPGFKDKIIIKEMTND
ncbi:hypothetical protein SJ_205 [Proteus phage SJ_PmiM]|nr:hypothetical protein SJ_205 [Proteus phage SJ_PmiM]